MIAALTLLLSVLAQPPSGDRQHEGDWFISDVTDNATGEREVYAMQSFIRAGDPDFVTLNLRCHEGAPAFYVDWSNVTFPDQTVLTIAATTSADDEAPEEGFIFTKSADLVKSGLRASPDATRSIIKFIGAARYATFTAHLAAGSREVGIKVAGLPGAWARVSRHCPVRRMPLPPI